MGGRRLGRGGPRRRRPSTGLHRPARRAGRAAQRAHGGGRGSAAPAASGSAASGGRGSPPRAAARRLGCMDLRPACMKESMPEGHTIHRLARDQRRLFGGQTLAAASPQGRFADGARLARRPAADAASTPTASTCSTPSTDCASSCTCISGSTASSPPGRVPAPRTAGRAAPAAEQRADLDRPARTDGLRAADPGRGPGHPRPARPRPAAPAGRPGTGVGADLAQPRGDRRPADGPVGHRRHRQRLPGRAALPRRHLALPSRPGRHPRRSGRRSGSTCRCCMRAGVRAGQIVTTRPEDRSRRTARSGDPRGALLRLPAARPAVPAVRHPGPHRGDGRAEPLLVPGRPVALSARSASPAQLTAELRRCQTNVNPGKTFGSGAWQVSRCGDLAAAPGGP